MKNKLVSGRKSSSQAAPKQSAKTASAKSPTDSARAGEQPAPARVDIRTAQPFTEKLKPVSEAMFSVVFPKAVRHQDHRAYAAACAAIYQRQADALVETAGSDALAELAKRASDELWLFMRQMFAKDAEGRYSTSQIFHRHAEQARMIASADVPFRELVQGIVPVALPGN